MINLLRLTSHRGHWIKKNRRERKLTFWVGKLNLIWAEFITKLKISYFQFSSVVQSCLTLRPHGLQHARPSRPSPTPRVYSNSCPLSRWCHPAISSSVVPFSCCFQSFPASAAAAKSLQSCLTLCDPIDGSPLGSPVPGILQARILEWVAMSSCKASIIKKPFQSFLNLSLFFG